MTVRDRWLVVSTLYYATPLLVLAVMSLGVAVVAAVKKREKMAWVAFALALVYGGWWHFGTWRDQAATAPLKAPPLRVMCWNIMAAIGGREPIHQRLHELDLDIIGLTEPGVLEKLDRYYSQTEFPVYHRSYQADNLLLLTRGEIVRESSGALGGDFGHYQVVEMNVRDTPLTVVQVDLKSNPLRSRRKAFEDLNAVLARYENQPTIVMGDFNTPRGSVWFEEIRHDFHHTFEEAGYGYAASWPTPVSVMMIDHIWASHSLRVTQSHFDPIWRSDHRALLAEIEWPPSQITP